MLAVQLFEFSLSTFGLVLTINQRRQSRGLSRDLGRIIKRGLHAYRRASASETARDLEAFIVEGRVDPDLHREIGRAIKWRDRLAHRYLREALVADHEGRPALREGSTAELAQLARSFDRLGQRVQREVEGVVAQLPAPDAPPEVVDALSQLGAKMALDRDLPPAKPPSTD